MNIRAFFLEAICDRVKERLKRPVVTVHDKPFVPDVTVEQSNRRVRNILNINKTVNAGNLYLL